VHYLGITGVEDTLQDNVGEVIAKIRESGIAIWMLTGDKVETAQCIAISTRLKTNIQRFFSIAGCTDKDMLNRRLLEFSRTSNEVLVLDGETLAVALDTNPKYFV
jgi:phospholipid-translocating ATPase